MSVNAMMELTSISFTPQCFLPQTSLEGIAVSWGHPSKEKETNELGLILPNPSLAIQETPWYTAGHFRKDAINTG